jgi:hypothetical protein
VAQKGQAPALADARLAAGQPCPGVHTMHPAMAFFPACSVTAFFKKARDKEQIKNIRVGEGSPGAYVVNENR